MEYLSTTLGFFEVPDMSGKVAIVTGANSGVGFELTKTLATHGAEIYMACRSKQRGEEAAAKILYNHPDAAGRLHVLECDLEDFPSIKNFAMEVLTTNKPIHLLANVAGQFTSAVSVMVSK
jgi:NAD(P)-dependent dehydrogenase (short-subunit alcohol dehydrogenase family)